MFLFSFFCLNYKTLYAIIKFRLCACKGAPWLHLSQCVCVSVCKCVAFLFCVCLFCQCTSCICFDSCDGFLLHSKLYFPCFIYSLLFVLIDFRIYSLLFVSVLFRFAFALLFAALLLFHVIISVGSVEG